MADAFIQKGATAYIGWTEEVDIGHSDNETIRLLRMLLEQNKTITGAVSKISPDWHFYPPESKMNFYPLSAGNLRISDLTVSAKASATSQITFNNLEQTFGIYVTCVARLQIKRISDVTFH